MEFSKKVLQLDPVKEVDRICRWIRKALSKELRKRGLVVAVSGGIDSSVTLALATKAVGKEKVLALSLPEKDSSASTRRLSKLAIDYFGAEFDEEDITASLEAVGHYRRYQAAVRSIIPGYGAGWRSKLVLSNRDGAGALNYFFLVAQDPDGNTIQKRLPVQAYLEVIAATSFKQRLRKMLEYYHADRLNYAVCGTPNRLEYDQGFFVKNGDGSADIKPIAHLYKSQVYQLAAVLDVPEEIRNTPPTTDTYTLSQGQDEFYFGVPYQKMDLCLFGKNHCIPAEQTAAATGMTIEQVQNIYADIDRKRRATQYLHLPPLVVEDEEISTTIHN